MIVVNEIINKKELKKKLSDAKSLSNRSYYAEAIALLHQVVSAYPESKHYYMLVATYLEIGENDTALEYLNAALKVDAKYKEAYDLKAKVNENSKEYILAEQMYLKAIEIDFKFIEQLQSHPKYKNTFSMAS